MNETKAIDLLAFQLDDHGFGDEDMARDMFNWLNTSEPDRDDIERLFDLAQHGNFLSWDSPSADCSERVYEGSPDSWDHFQGVLQNDRTSFPGFGQNDARCSNCRCFGISPESIFERKDLRH